MRRNQYPDGSIESSFYDTLFGPADRMTKSFELNGRYSLYGSDEDIDDTAAYDRSPQENSNQRQCPGQTSGPSWLDNDMTRQLQNLSLTNSAWEDDIAETSVRRGGTSVLNVPEVNLDHMSYEASTLLQGFVGTENKGLSKQEISMLNTHEYTASKGKGESEGDTKCVICLMEYESGQKLATLPCAHQYHEECIKKWLEDNKGCCVCKQEVKFNSHM